MRSEGLGSIACGSRPFPPECNGRQMANFNSQKKTTLRQMASVGLGVHGLCCFIFSHSGAGLRQGSEKTLDWFEEMPVICMN